MKNRKSILIVLLLGCLLLSAGCGSKKPQPTQPDATEPTAALTDASKPDETEAGATQTVTAASGTTGSGTPQDQTESSVAAERETVKETAGESGTTGSGTTRGAAASTAAAESRPASTETTEPEKVTASAPETHDRSERELKASFDSIADGSKILEAYRSNEIAFSNEAKLYGMNSETAALVTYKEGSFRCYVLKLKLKNAKKYDLTVHSVLSPDNGKNGVWVCGVSQYGTFDVAAKSTAYMPVTVLVDSSVTPFSGVEKALRSMNLTLEYTDLTDGVTEKNGEVGTAVVKM